MAGDGRFSIDDCRLPPGVGPRPARPSGGSAAIENRQSRIDHRTSPHRRPWVAAPVLTLALAWSLRAEQPPAPAPLPAPAPAQHVLALPTGIPGAAPAASAVLECRVAAGTLAPVTALAFAPDGRHLAAGGAGEVLLWDVEQGRLTRRLGAGQLTGPVLALAFHRSGHLLAVGEGTPGRSGAVRIVDVDSGTVCSSAEAGKDTVRSLAFSPDGALLAAGCGDGVIRVWDVQERKPVAELTEPGGEVNGINFSPDGKSLLAGGADRVIREYGTSDWRPAPNRHAPEMILSLAAGPDGLLAVAVGEAGLGSVRLWPKDAKADRAIDLGATVPQDLAWMGKTGRLAVACTDRVLRIHDAKKPATVAVPTGHTDWLYCVASNADGTRLVTGGADGLVKLFAGDGKLLATFVHLASRTERWLVLSVPGYFDGSEPAAVEWKTPAPLTGKPGQVTEKLRQGDLLRQVLAGKTVPPPALK